MRAGTKGLLLGIIGITILSPDALILRLIDCDDYAVIAMRSIFIAIMSTFLIYCFPSLRFGFRWPPILLYGCFFAVGLSTFPLSIQNTHVANTLVILSTAPIFAAIGAQFILREKTALLTWITGLVICIGIAVIFSHNINGDGMLGNMFALITAIILAINSIIARQQQKMALFPGTLIGGLLTAVIFTILAQWDDVDARDLALSAIDGGVILTFSFLFIIMASRLLPPAEVNLIFLLETILGSGWVWLVLHEAPPLETVMAGGLIIVSLAVHGLWSLKNIGQSSG